MEKDIYEIPKTVYLRVVIAQNLKTLRKKHGITQERLAAITGINRISITRYETCQMSISLEHLLIIAKALNEEPNNILEGWEEYF